MNRTVVAFLLIPLFLVAAVSAAGQATSAEAPVGSPNLSPGIAAIIKMHQSGVPGDMIVKAAQASGNLSTLTPDDLIALKRANVPDEVIRAIAEQSQQNPSAAPPSNRTSANNAMTSSVSITESGGKPAPVIDLKSVKRIFVEKMPEDLDQYIRAEITKKFKGSVLVVLNPESADALMVGVGEKKEGVGAAITGRYLGLHDNATGAVSLVDKSGQVVLWSSEAGDRSLWWGALKRGGPRKVADRLVNNLKKAMGM